MPKITHLDFHISYTCLNKCIFCSSADSVKKFSSHSLKTEEILKILRNKRKLGFESVNFTGGEPTLFKNFFELVKKTKKLGYRIYVGTNGGRFKDMEFCKKTAPFINEVCFSVHGHKSSLHNLHAQNSKSFNILNKAIKNLSNFPIRFSSNTVITKYNFFYLDKILKFLTKKNIKQSMISNLAPEGRGLKNYDELVARIEKIKKKIPTLIKIAEKSDIILRFFGLPSCVLGEHKAYSNDFHWDERINVEQVKEREKYYLKEEKAKINRGRIKSKKCDSCLYNEICGGIFKEYYKKFGDNELNPIL